MRVPFRFDPESPLWEVGSREYFRDYRRQRELHLHPPIEEEVAKETLVAQSVLIEESDMPTKMKAVNELALSTGMQTWPRRALRLQHPVYLKSGPNAGEMRTPEKHLRAYWLTGRYPGSLLGFEAHWEGPGAGKLTGPFQYARALDPVGIQEDNWHDYGNSALNDALNFDLDMYRMNKQVTFPNVDSLIDWLNEWKGLLVGDDSGT